MGDSTLSIERTCCPVLSARLAAGEQLLLSASALKLLLSQLLPDAAPETTVAVWLVIMTMLASQGLVLMESSCWMQSGRWNTLCQDCCLARLCSVSGQSTKLNLDLFDAT